MSAFEVSGTHIDVLVSAALQRRHGSMLRWYWTGAQGEQSREISEENAEQVGATLLAENRRSVNYRYSEDEFEAPYTLDVMVGSFDPVKMMKAIDCYEYQTCEHPEWPQSEAHAFCAALTARMIHDLPGYSDGPWEVTNPAQVMVGAPCKVIRAPR